MNLSNPTFELVEKSSALIIDGSLFHTSFNTLDDVEYDEEENSDIGEENFVHVENEESEYFFSFSDFANATQLNNDTWIVAGCRIHFLVKVVADETLTVSTKAA